MPATGPTARRPGDVLGLIRRDCGAPWMCACRRGQHASIRPSIEYTKQLFPESFVFYIPRKNVGGDFYWFEKKRNYIYVATVDCSGYGLSVAFLSHITYNILNLSLKEHSAKKPSTILDDLNMDISYKFHKDYDNKKIKKTFSLSRII